MMRAHIFKEFVNDTIQTVIYTPAHVGERECVINDGPSMA